MEKLILITLLALPIASWGEPSQKTRDLLWNTKVTPMTLGLLHCNQHADKVGLNNCHYSFKRDKIIVTHLSKKLIGKNKTLDDARKTCVSEVEVNTILFEILTLVPKLTDIFNGFFHYGIVPADKDSLAVSDHIRNNLEVIIALEPRPLWNDQEFYVCTFRAKDKDSVKSMSIKYLNTAQYYGLLE